MTTAMHDSALMTVSEYARRVNVSEVTVRRWAREGLIPAQRFGPRLWRIDPDAPLPVLPTGRRGRRPVTGRLR